MNGTDRLYWIHRIDKLFNSDILHHRDTIM